MTALALALLPLVGGAALVGLNRYPRVLAPVAVAVVLATLALGVSAATSEPSIAWSWSPAIELELRVEGFSRVMVVLVPLIAAPVIAYAGVTEEEGRMRLLALLLVFVGAMLLLVTAADFVSLLIGWELVGAASWALIGHGWRDSDNTRAAAQAFITTRFGDLGLYIAAGLTFAGSGGFAFADLGRVDGSARDAIAAGILLAAAAKSAQLPFSPWLFSAMAGPTAVSALLHSATMVAAGAYLLIRLAPLLEPVEWFAPTVAGLGLATALAGGVVATLQTHPKRLLAGSTSAQYGLMFIAIGAGSVAAAGGQLVAHAAFKSLLFLGAGIAMHAAGSSDLAAMRLGRALPRVALLSAIGALALAAVPPLGGAWTKEQIVSAAVESSVWLGAGALAAGFLSALYAARYQLLVYGPRDAPSGPTGPADGRSSHIWPRYKPGRVEVASIAALATITLVLSLLWLPGAKELAERATDGELPPGPLWEFGAALATIVVAFGLVAGLWRRGLLVSLGLPPAIQTAAGDWLGVPVLARRLVVDPVLLLSSTLARFDAQVVDAGVRGAAALARLASGLLSVRIEWSVDSAVRAAAAITMAAAGGSRVSDEAGVDAAVEGGARGVGIAGRVSRRLQTGLSHHYYVIVVAGLIVSVAVLAASL